MVLVTAGAGWWFYEHLNGNINSVSLDGKGGTEKADAFGRTPINILVIGSDGRTSAADCKLGGGCRTTGVQTGNGNADVEMVVHISADRSNATVMSIPRDTMVNVPACKDTKSGESTSGYYGQVNSALQYGPACQVSTIHQLTGITIDHFVKLDFSGVVKMSDAVGCVSVCVNGNVYDTYSHLKLSKGTHTLKGEAALEFRPFPARLRRRQRPRSYRLPAHLPQRDDPQVQECGHAHRPHRRLRLADAATKALTVDDGLGTVKKLISQAADVNKVPTKRMTFTTMQTAPDPTNSNRVVVGAGAKDLFATMANDQSLTTSSGKKSSAASATAKPTPTVAAPSPRPDRRDGRERTDVTGRASVIANSLISQGFSTGTSTANAPTSATSTTLTYGSGDKGEAQTVAKALDIPSSHIKSGSGPGVVLVIGSDWTSGSSYPASSGDTKVAVSNANASTAKRRQDLRKVSQYKTVSLNGVPMDPGPGLRGGEAASPTRTSEVSPLRDGGRGGGSRTPWPASASPAHFAWGAGQAVVRWS